MKSNEIKLIGAAFGVLLYIVFILRAFSFYSGMNYAALPYILKIIIAILTLFLAGLLFSKRSFREVAKSQTPNKFARFLTYPFVPVFIYFFIYMNCFVAINLYEEQFANFKEYQPCYRSIKWAHRKHNRRRLDTCEIVLDNPPSKHFGKIDGNKELCNDFEDGNILRLTFQVSSNGRRSLKYFELAPVIGHDLNSDCFIP